MHTYNVVPTVVGVVHFFVFSVSEKVKLSVFSCKGKLTIPLLCVCVHSAWKGRP